MKELICPDELELFVVGFSVVDAAVDDDWVVAVVVAFWAEGVVTAGLSVAPVPSSRTVVVSTSSVSEESKIN